MRLSDQSFIPLPFLQGYMAVTEIAMFPHILTILATTNPSGSGTRVGISQSPPSQLTIPWVSF